MKTYKTDLAQRVGSEMEEGLVKSSSRLRIGEYKTHATLSSMVHTTKAYTHDNGNTWFDTNGYEF